MESGRLIIVLYLSLKLHQIQSNHLQQPRYLLCFFSTGLNRSSSHNPLPPSPACRPWNQQSTATKKAGRLTGPSPTRQQSPSYALRFLFPSSSNGSHRSSFKLLLYFALLYSSLQLQQTFPGNHQATQNSETGKVVMPIS